MKKQIILLIFVALSIVACNGKKGVETSNTDTNMITDEQQDFLGITNKDKLSAASKRALAWPMDLGNEWFF